jgi:hypothetical protein
VWPVQPALVARIEAAIRQFRAADPFLPIHVIVSNHVLGTLLGCSLFADTVYLAIEVQLPVAAAMTFRTFNAVVARLRQRRRFQTLPVRKLRMSQVPSSISKARPCRGGAVRSGAASRSSSGVTFAPRRAPLRRCAPESSLRRMPCTRECRRPRVRGTAQGAARRTAFERSRRTRSSGRRPDVVNESTRSARTSR